jgi:exopolysaccharide production protein ExoQ
MGYLVATSFWIFVIWLIRRDTASRDGISAATWIPTLWAGILLSRPVSLWLGFGGSADSLEGSPMDRLFYFGAILASIAVLSRRNVNWPLFLQQNWPVLLLYGFYLVSVTWSESPIPSFKRWFKDFGNVFVALVVLTDRNPFQATKAVFVRCAYVLFPLSIIFIRWFPELGRYYSRSGGLHVVGVTTQKNSLGILVVVCGLILLWDWLERSRDPRYKKDKLARALPVSLLAIGVYLLYLCDSQTSIICICVGAMILLSSRVPLLRNRVGALGVYSLIGVAAYLMLDSAFGIKNALLGTMGRDASLTGRTDVWRELLALKTDPIIGTGFLSFWSDQHYQSQLPNWVAFSAHNGYLETYIDGGYVALFFLVLMLAALAVRINRKLTQGHMYVLFQFAVLWVTLIGNYSESHFARMSPLWFLFLLTSLTVPNLWRTPRLNQQPSIPATTNARPMIAWLPAGK